MRKSLLFFLFSFFLFLNNVGYAQSKITIIPDQSLENSNVTMDVAEAAQNTIRYMKDNFGMELRHDITVKIVKDKETYTSFLQKDQRLSSSDAVMKAEKTNASTNQETIILCLPENSSKTVRHFLASHELIHHFQYEIVRPDRVRQNVWFIEGMADVLAINITSKVDPTIETVMKKNLFDFYLNPANEKPDLSSITLATDWNASLKKNSKGTLYYTADVAMYYLVRNYGYQSIFDYCTALNTKTPTKAFTDIYKLEISDLNSGLYIFSQVAQKELPGAHLDLTE